MAENKTARNDTDPLEFIAGLDNPRRQEESPELLDLFKFGSHDDPYASGRSGSWMRVGSSPRKQQMTVHVMPGFERYEDLLASHGRPVVSVLKRSRRRRQGHPRGPRGRVVRGDGE